MFFLVKGRGTCFTFLFVLSDIVCFYAGGSETPFKKHHTLMSTVMFSAHGPLL